MVRRFLALVLTLALTLAFLPWVPPASAVEGWTITQVTDYPGYDMDPVISGDNVAWYGWDGDDREIYFWTVGDPTYANISDNEGAVDDWVRVSGDRVAWRSEVEDDVYEVYTWAVGDAAPTLVDDSLGFTQDLCVEGDRLVWQGWDTVNTSWDIYTWVVGDPAPTNISNTSSSDEWAPHVSGDRVVWSGDASVTEAAREIYLWTAGGGAPVNISNRVDLGDEHPCVSGDRVVWSGYDDAGDAQIYLWAVGDPAPTNISNLAGASNYGPQISGERVVWVSEAFPADSEIYTWAVGDAAPTQLTDNAGYDERPQISGDRVVWQYWDGDDSEIYTWAAGDAAPTRLTDNAAEDEDPQVSGDRIVWYSDLDGNYDIYLAEPVVANVAPVAVDDFYETPYETTLVVSAAEGLLANDYDPDGDAISVQGIDLPSHGTLYVTKTDGSFTYVPDAGFVGTDTIGYRIEDGTAISPSATFTITVTPVNAAPVGEADSYGTMQDETLVVTAGDGVLSNDTDPDGDALTAVLYGDPFYHGVIALSPDGSFTYTPATGFTGTDYFTYRAYDGSLYSNVVTVNITVADELAGTFVINGGDEYSTSRDLVLESSVPVAIDMRLRASTDGGTTWGSWTDWMDYDPTFEITVGADGLWTYQIEYQNGDETLTLTDSITVDTVAPVITVTGVSNGATYDGPVTPVVTFSGHVSSVLKLDGFPFVSGTAVTAEGVHTLWAQATDAAGNIAEKTVVFTITGEVALPDGSWRVAGANRYLTSVAASKRGFPTGAKTIVIAKGTDWPDALGGSALAGAVDGPLLLTKPDALPSEVSYEITRLGATKAYILGSDVSISKGVADALAAKGLTVIRLGGSNRYETARKVADETIKLLGSGYTGDAFVATGLNFPDATGAAPLAAALGRPILLANISAGTVSLPPAVERVVILGSTAAVPATVETYLDGKLGASDVDRKGGANRYATAALVAQLGVDNGMRWDGTGIATGLNFPDALSGGAMLGKLECVLLLTRPDVLAGEARTKLYTNRNDIDTLFIFGDTNAVSAAVEAAAKAAATVE